MGNVYYDGLGNQPRFSPFIFTKGSKGGQVLNGGKFSGESLTLQSNLFKDGLIKIGADGDLIVNDLTGLTTIKAPRLESTTPCLQFSETDTTDENFEICLNSGELRIRKQNNAFNSSALIAMFTQNKNLIMSEIDLSSFTFEDRIVTADESGDNKFSMLSANVNSGTANTFRMDRWRGGLLDINTASAAVFDGDILGGIYWRGAFTGGTLGNAAQMIVKVDGTVTGTAIPSSFNFFVTDSSGILTQHLKIDGQDDETLFSRDIRFASANATNMFYGDRTNDRIGINRSSPLGTLHLSPVVIGDQPLKITGISGQTADFFNIEDSSLSELFSIDSVGGLNMKELQWLTFDSNASGTQRIRGNTFLGIDIFSYECNSTYQFKITSTINNGRLEIFFGESSGNQFFRLLDSSIKEIARWDSDGIITQIEASTPATPTTGYVKLYPKTDGNYYQLDDTGLETLLALSPDIRSKRTTGDQTKNNDTTFADDPDMAGWSLKANKAYKVMGYLVIEALTSGTPDFKFQFTYSGTGTIELGWRREDNTTSGHISAFSTSSGKLALTAATMRYFVFRGSIITTGAGILNFQWAQDVADASDVTLFAESWIEIMEESL